MSELEFGLD